MKKRKEKIWKKFDQLLSSKEAFLGTFRKWFTKGVWSIVDQALYAGTHFFLTIFLARNLDAVSFGTFAFIYSIYLFISMAYRSFVFAPMMFLGPKKYIKSQNRYRIKMVRKHWSITGVTWLIALFFLAVMAYIFQFYEQIFLTISVLVSFPCMLFVLFMRRASYVVLKPPLSVVGSLIYGLIILAMLFWLQKNDMLFLHLIIFVIGASALIAGFIVSFFLGKEIDVKKDEPFRDIGKEHWDYGKWLVLAALLTWISSQVFYGLLVFYSKVEAAGALKALMVLVQPIFHVNIGLSALLIPALVRSNVNGTESKSLIYALIVFCGLAVVYSIFLIFFGQDLLILIYGENSPYAGFKQWSPLLALLPIFHSLITVFGSLKQAMNKTKSFATAYIISAISSVLIGVLLIPHFGIGGAIIGLVVSHFFTAATLGYQYLYSKIRNPDSNLL